MLVSYLLSLATAFQFAATNPALVVESCDFGEVMAFSKAQCDIVLSNHSNEEIRITGVSSSREDISLHSENVVVPANGKTYLHVTIDVGNSVGGVSYPLVLETSEKGHARRSARGNGFVTTVVDQIRPTLDLGAINTDSSVLEEKSIALSSNEIPDLRMEKVIESPDWLDARIEGNKLHVKPRRNFVLGLRDGFVKVAINSPRQTQVWVHVKADIRGEVIPSVNPLDMGLMRSGNANQHLIRLTDKQGREIKVGSLTLENVQGKAVDLPCESGAKGCRMIRLTISDKQPEGFIKGRLLIDLPDLKQKLPVSIGGMLVAKDQKIETFGPNSSSPAGKGDEVSPSNAASNVSNLQQSIESSIRGASNGDSPPPAGSGPLLKWATKDGADVYGFQIFRAKEKSGPFSLMNEKLIKAIRQPNGSSYYQWRDATAESGRKYWYYVGIVRTDGSKQQLTGAQEVLAK
ncbi:hypothetical protein [Dokdonella sp.]|uniref:hypothetical protein n=1 Tax=Dokdonella sp. TaxID=2291710 RepID=UPI001B036DEA|nr:hypothetical protein [Dokdonella sp.]MBO9662357.1 hypothetical protein [Dokdonella sp.]